MEQLRVGIVGAGYIGKKHIEAVRRIPGAEIVGVVDADVGCARRIAREMNIPHAYGTADEMLARAKAEVVHVCTPTALHYEVSKKVIEAGCHLYCEKPLTVTRKEAEKLAALVAGKGLANGVNLNYRMNALVQEIHERIACGEAGRVFSLSGAYLQDWMLRQDDYDWRVDPSLGGPSRALSDIGSHLFDLCQYILGKRIVAVSARTRILHPKRLHYEKPGGTFSLQKGRLLDEITVHNEDEALVMARFEDGTEGLLQVSQVASGHKNDLHVRIDAERCSFEWQQERADLLYIGRRGGPNEVLYREAAALHERAQQYTHLPAGHSEGWSDALLIALETFYRSIRQGTFADAGMPYATVQDGLWVMKVIEACLQSNRAEGWVDVETGDRL